MIMPIWSGRGEKEVWGRRADGGFETSGRFLHNIGNLKEMCALFLCVLQMGLDLGVSLRECGSVMVRYKTTFHLFIFLSINNLVCSSLSSVPFLFLVILPVWSHLDVKLLFVHRLRPDLPKHGQALYMYTVWNQSPWLCVSNAVSKRSWRLIKGHIVGHIGYFQSSVSTILIQMIFLLYQTDVEAAWCQLFRGPVCVSQHGAHFRPPLCFTQLHTASDPPGENRNRAGLRTAEEGPGRWHLGRG